MIPIKSARIIILYFHRYQKESKGIARQPDCDIIANGIVYQRKHGTVTIDATSVVNDHRQVHAVHFRGIRKTPTEPVPKDWTMETTFLRCHERIVCWNLATPLIVMMTLNDPLSIEAVPRRCCVSYVLCSTNVWFRAGKTQRSLVMPTYY